MKYGWMLGTAVFALAAAAPSSAQELKFPVGEGENFTWESFEEFKGKFDLAGETVTVFGPWLGPDKDLIENVLAYFEEATGANVEYAGSDSFEQQIVIDTQAGSPPNVAVFPQPGLVADMVEKGNVVPLGEETAQWISENYAAGESWVDLSSFEGPDGKEQLYAFPYKADVKSLVFYVPENFEEMGYEIPGTMEDLIALSEQIVEDGGTPWCIGLGSGAATGWPATDWVEDILLRTAPPETYDKWVTNEIPFNDPAVVNAIETFGTFARNDDFVDGGAAAVSSTDFRDSPKGLFSSPPKCYLHHQASFIPSFFPEGTELGVDADFFYFPAFEDEKFGKPVLGAGTMFAITKESEGAKALIEFLKTPIAHEVWMAQSGFLTPYKDANPATYENDALRKQGEILTQATTFRFDGSDLMPGKIGAGAFWTGMVDFTGGKSAEEAASAIQGEWDGLK